VPTLIVIGAGDSGRFYVRQLLRAVAAGKLAAERITVVDRDADRRERLPRDPRVQFECAAWADWLDAHLASARPQDQLVPYHWAPHLLVGWLANQAEREGARVRRGGPLRSRGLPFERDTAAGDRALSYASWTCPVTCIEPRLCPHTRGPRDWSLAGDLAALRPDDAADDAIVFGSFHLAYGVAAIRLSTILEARSRVLAGLARGTRRYLVSTSSHCHALATLLTVSPGAAVRARTG
jgi:hypothetical protein